MSDKRFRLSGDYREEALARYVIAEHRRGRTLAEIFEDPNVRNRADETTLMRLLDDPDVIEHFGRDAVDSLRGRLDA